MASNSSIKIIHAPFPYARVCAFLNNFLTRAAPTPTNISVNSLPDMDMKGMPASVAMALARYVLPQPGGPTSNRPLKILPPIFKSLVLSFISSTTSSASCFASSIPMTSSQWIFTFSPFIVVCFIFVNPPCRNIMYIKTNMPALSPARRMLIGIWAIVRFL